MATIPSKPDEAPRDDSNRGNAAPVPDEGDIHDVPDDEVIEQTLPTRDKPR